MKRKHIKYVVIVCVVVYLYHYLGISDYLNAKDFDTDFSYPLNVDTKKIVNDVLRGGKVTVDPINYYPYRFLSNSGICATVHGLDLLIAVKSAMNNFDLRKAIRITYGQEYVPGHTIKTLFFVGVDREHKSEVQKRIDREMAEFKDIIQMDFIDNYYNNTIKTMMTFRWMFEHCSSAKYYFFTDDDMYISIRNLMRVLHEREESRKAALLSNGSPSTPAELEEDCLFMGYVFQSSPQRFLSSKWRVSLQEYRWNKWPRYVTAMAYVVSNRAMKKMYIGSLYVKHFRFDDIYLAIVAKKVGITPVHCPHFYFYKLKFTFSGYERVIASHGYKDPDELANVWSAVNTHDIVKYLMHSTYTPIPDHEADLLEDDGN